MTKLGVGDICVVSVHTCKLKPEDVYRNQPLRSEESLKNFFMQKMVSFAVQRNHKGVKY